MTTGEEVPPAVVGPEVWTGADLQDDDRWIIRLDDEAIADLDELVRIAGERDLRVPFDDGDVPIGSMAAVADRAVELLDHGPGLALIRGLPRHRYTKEQCELIYWAIGVRLGRPVSQNAKGHLIGHVRDIGRSISDPDVRSYQTNGRLDYHADQLPVDVLGLLCLETARTGGASMIVSAMTIHNLVREERPDLLPVLYRPYNLDWRGEEPAGERPWYRQPMFSEAEGKVSSRFTTLAYFRSVTRHGPHLAMTPDQEEALELVQAMANRPGLAISMMFEPGDIQLLNNHVMLHAREAYVDHPEPERRRHLLRMWIAYPHHRRRALSPLLADRDRLVRQGGIPTGR